MLTVVEKILAGDIRMVSHLIRDIDDGIPEAKEILKGFGVPVPNGIVAKTPEEAESTRFNCWCNQTQHVMGPNNELVDRVTCVEGRDCYCPRA